MINEKKAKIYCFEDISLIENYQEAIADKEKTWDIHHRRECDDEGQTLFTKKQLIEMNLYFNRQASELIFVTRSMHKKIHREQMQNCGKISGKIVGKKYGAINGKKRSIPVIQFSKSREFIKEWHSAHDAQRQLGISQSNICQCC